MLVFFFTRHEELKAMLDGNKDNLKLEAMKHVIGVSEGVSECVGVSECGGEYVCVGG